MSDRAPQSTPSTIDPAPALAMKARDLVSLFATISDAATVSGPLWVSYLLALFYFLIAAGAVIHKDLLMEQPVKLPFLGIDLPMVGFFGLAPIIFLVLHAYVLLHFVILTAKVTAFDNELRRQISDRPTRQDLRRQLPTSIFVQFLAGPRVVRQGFLGLLLWLILTISLLIGPVLLLLFFLLQFLPYHSQTIAWTQRVTVVLDLLLLWLLWPQLSKLDEPACERSRWRRRLRVCQWRMTKKLSPSVLHLIGKIGRFLRFPGQNAGYVAAALASAFVLTLAFLIATFPGEWLDDQVRPRATWMPGIQTIRIILVEGEVDEASRRPRSWFSNVLILPYLDVTDDARFNTPVLLGAAHRTISLRGRDLRGAVLTAANLSKAELDYANLEGASLDVAQLTGASLQYTKLNGASLSLTSLQGASLMYAQLQGASLSYAHLQGASLDHAHLEGVTFLRANLEGASFDSAQLQGALFAYVQLQGASFNDADLSFAMMLTPYLWRAAPSGKLATELRVQHPETGPMRGTVNGQEQWSSTYYAGFKAELESDIPPGKLRDSTLRHIMSTLDPAQPLRGEDVMAANWRRLAEEGTEPDWHAAARVAGLKALACAADDAPYLLIGLNRNFLVQGSVLPSDVQRDLARAFLAYDCLGARGLGSNVREHLQKIAKNDSSTIIGQ